MRKDPGVWEGKIDTSRIYNHDETENRACVTIHPFVSPDGCITICHFILKGESITSNMITTNAVENIENLLKSTTESGSQDGRSCYEVYKFFNHVIDDNKKTVVVLTDGHSSRFNVDVLRTCRDEKLRQYLGPPDSTHATQLLDQINAALHHSYHSSSKVLFKNEAVDRHGFLDILASIWSKRVTKESIVKAGKRVGISEEGLNWQWMQTYKFAQSEALITSSPEKVSSKPVWQADPPKDVRIGTAEYHKRLYEARLEISKKQAELPVTPEDLGIVNVQKIHKVKKK